MGLTAAHDERSSSWCNERSVGLGCGLIRGRDGTFWCPLVVDVSVRCLGPLAQWQIHLQYGLTDLQDGEERPVFLFPLPDDASLSRVEMRRDGVPNTLAVVSHRVDLPEQVAVPIASPSLVESFKKETSPVLSLGLERELRRGEASASLEIYLEFASRLPSVDGRLRLMLPGTIAPELQASQDSTMRAHVWIEDADDLVDAPLVPGGFQERRDEVGLHLEAQQIALVSDLEISFRLGRTEMPVTRLLHSADHFIFSIFPPTSIPASPQRRDLVFAVDASENVSDGLYEVVRDDLMATLRRLDDHDRFALVTYGRDIDGFQGGEFCDVNLVEEACAWLEGVEPKGRADIQPLLTRIQDLPAQPDRQLCVFLLAAGHVGNEPSILKGLDFDQSDRRYFAIGVGSSVQQSFLRRLALLARGRWEKAPQGHCAPVLARMLGQTRALLAEVTFEDLDNPDYALDEGSLVPSRMGSLTPEGPVHCLGKGAPESLRFRSKDETGVFFAGTVHARSTDNPALAGVWAGMRSRELLDSIHLAAGAKRQQLREESVALALDYGLLIEDTVLSRQGEQGLEIELSVFPYQWDKRVPPVVKADEATSSTFDWRKGLKARGGLFKGGKDDGGELSAEGVRRGLRRAGEPRTKKGRAGMEASKPMLDRPVYTPAIEEKSLGSEEGVEQPQGNAVVEDVDEAMDRAVAAVAEDGQTLHSTDLLQTFSVPLADPVPESNLEKKAPGRVVEQEPELSAVSPALSSRELNLSMAKRSSSASVELSPSKIESPIADKATVEGEETLKDASELSHSKELGSAAALAPVVIAQTSEPIFHFVRDPMAEASVRYDAYAQQMASSEARLALAGLAALPSDVAATGPDLPRILAQAVGHLEKRGYFSSAVSVLGILLRDYSSPEVFRKLESLLLAWAGSLGDDHLPEAFQILQAGLRLCPDSESIQSAIEACRTRWENLAQAQAALPSVVQWKAQAAPTAQVFSAAQLELLEIKEQQKAMEAELSSLNQSVHEQLAALPAMIGDLVAKSLSSFALQPVPHALASKTHGLTPAVMGPSGLSSSLAAEPPVIMADERVSALPVESPTFGPDELSSALMTEPLVAELDGVLSNMEAEPPIADTGESLSSLLVGMPGAAMSDAPIAAGRIEDQPYVDDRASSPSETIEAQVVSSIDDQVLDPMVASPGDLSSQPVASTPAESPLLSEDASLVGRGEKTGLDSIVLGHDELLKLLQDDPRGSASHRAVQASLTNPKDRISFYRELVGVDKDEAYHSLSLGRAYREAQQTKVAVVHYQKYLRSEKDAAAYLELAEAYDELGKANLSISARKTAELLLAAK